MKKVFVVEGETGEYEEIRRWNAFAYFSEEKANAKAAELNALLISMELHTNLENRISYDDRMKKKNEFIKKSGDAYALLDYTGAEYYVYQIEVEE